MIKIDRIYSDPDGESHFGEFDVALKDSGNIGSLAQLQEATGIIFRETPADYDYAWHNAPRRQYVIILEGQVDITVSDGLTKRFGNGDVLLCEDTSGKGHYAKAVNGQRRKSIFITLD